MIVLIYIIGEIKMTRIEEVVKDIVDDEPMLRKYTEQLEDGWISTLPLRTFLMNIKRRRDSRLNSTKKEKTMSDKR